MIRLAIQKSGRLNNDSLSLLKDCGINIENERIDTDHILNELFSSL